MQLKPRSVRRALAVATGTLLAAPGHAADGAADLPEWEVDSALLFYTEQDRVSAIEPVVEARRDLGDDESLRLRVVVDSLTGSSPNGAVPTGSPQTFTSPSGNSTYTTPANQTPLDPTFRDTRGAVSVEWERPAGRGSRILWGANVSKEFDYQSLGVSATWLYDTHGRNTTYTAGLAYSLDTVNPIGGVPVGLSPVPTSVGGAKATAGSDDTKQVFDVLLGVTQIIDRQSLVQFNLSLGRDSGYLTDPYKLLSVFDAGGNLRPADPYLYEKRPDSRQRQAAYVKWVRGFGDDVLYLSYRYFRDDWGIRSHTLGAKYRWQLGEHQYLQPELRWYRQSKADFYHYKLQDGAIPEVASADYRLADLKTVTAAVKWAFEADETSEWGFRAGLMRQQSDGDAPFPDVNAAFVQLNYRLSF